MSAPEDRRKSKRYYFKALLQLADSGEFSNVSLESINISSGGIFFRSSTNLEIGRELNIILALPEWPQPIEARCTVMHVLETIPNRQYFVGVSFSSLEGITPADLDHYLGTHFD